MTSRLAVVALACLVSGGCGSPPVDPAIRTMTVFDLAVAFDRAQTFVAGPGSAARGTFEVGSELRTGLRLNAASSVLFPPVPVSEDSLLTFKLGVVKDAWNELGDGMEFVVFAQSSNDARSKIFSRYVDPKHRAEDRQWIDERVPLRAFRGRQVRLTFAVEPGPAGNFTGDWAVWAEPQVMLGTGR